MCGLAFKYSTVCLTELPGVVLAKYMLSCGSASGSQAALTRIFHVYLPMIEGHS